MLEILKKERILVEWDRARHIHFAFIDVIFQHGFLVVRRRTSHSTKEYGFLISQQFVYINFGFPHHSFGLTSCNCNGVTCYKFPITINYHGKSWSCSLLYELSVMVFDLVLWPARSHKKHKRASYVFMKFC